MPNIKIQIYRERKLIDTRMLSPPVIVGRQWLEFGDGPPISISMQRDHQRLVIVDQQNLRVPRSWFQINRSSSGAFEIKNIHASAPIDVANDQLIAVGECRSVTQAMLLNLGAGIAIRVIPPIEETDDPAYRTLASRPLAPGTLTSSVAVKSIGNFSQPEALDIAELLKLALQVVQEAAGSDAFFQSAVDATSRIVGLDRTVLLVNQSAAMSLQQVPTDSSLDDWGIIAEQGKKLEFQSRPLSHSLLERVKASGTTTIHDTLAAMRQATPQSEIPQSLMGVQCAVAAPILDAKQQVIGVLYGDRLESSGIGVERTIHDFEATLVQILAGAVAGGIARQHEVRLRHTLSEFFSPKVTEQLARNPELMLGQDAEVSVLFCDIRGFSAVTETLGPRIAIDWINDVMSELSQCVIDSDGVLVDYVGDELLAMWGAPGEQPDHAARAVLTARRMLQSIETLRDRWAAVLPQHFGAGIGVNTGPARVGNVGSRQKFKYGALGNTVNLGSRLQSATKQLGVDCIISAATALAARCHTDCRRIARVCVVGIETPVEVFQLIKEDNEAWLSLFAEYQRALDDYECQRFRESAQRLSLLLEKFGDDHPSRMLLARVVAELDQPTAGFTGIWKLATK